MEFTSKRKHTSILNSFKTYGSALRLPSLLFGLMLCSFSANAAWLSMVGGNTLDGSQLSVNTFGKAGTMGSFAAGSYYYTLTRTGSFTANNIVFSVNGVAWGSNNTKFISSTTQNISISGIIPSGTACGVTETIVMKIYNISSQLVLSNTFIVRNPAQPATISKFKIFDSDLAANILIKGCQCTSKNILSNNITIKYTGSGTVLKHQIRIQQVTSTGGPVTNGFMFTQNWVTAAVPASINLKTLTGVTTGSAPTTWTYFLVTLETIGKPCSGSPGVHTALVLLQPDFCLNKPR